MFGIRARRRRRLLAEPFPAAWQALLHREVGLYASLDSGERARLRDDLRVFIAETGWEGTRDHAIDESMKVVIAANACMLTLAMEDEPLRRVRTIIVQPGAYVPPQPSITGGIAQVGVTASGTAYSNGTVVLSWRDLRRESRFADDGRNVVLHEFAHQLDMADGVVNGTPPIRERRLRERWVRVMTDEYADLVEATERGMPSLLRAYGATNPGEFFAVATECFFERPIAMRRHRPDLYDVLRAYYRQDVARRLEAHDATR